MNVVIHQMRTDVRRLRWWLVAWGVLLAGATVVPSLKLDLLAGTDESAGRLLAAHAVLLNAVALFAWVIAVRIVDGDPLDGTTAFWLTRPLSPRQLFTAKIGTLLALFVLLPAVAGTVVAAANGAGGGIVFAFLAESALVWLVFVLAVTLPATLTRDVARLVLTGIATGIAWLTLHALLFGFISMAPTTTRAVARYSGLLVGAIWFCAGCLAIIAGQYVSRRTRRSLLLTAVLAASTLGVVTFWPWPLVVPRHPVSDAAFNPASVEVSLSAVERAPAASSYFGDTRYSPGDFRVGGVPAGWVVVPFTVEASLRLSDGTTVAYHDDTWLSDIGRFETAPVVGMAPPGLDAVGFAARGRWLNDPWVPSTDARKERDWREIPLTIFAAPARLLRSDPGATADYSATLTCGAFRARIGAVLPLQRGAAARVDALETTVVRVRREPESGNGIRLGLRTAWPRVLFPHPVPGLAYVLRNTTRGELAMGHLRGPASSSARVLGLFRASAVNVRYDELAFSSTRNRVLALDDEWLAGAELVIVALEEQGTFTKTVHIPDFPLK